MLYYLGSHRWLWGRGGWESQHANALPPVSLRSSIMPFTPAAHAVHTLPHIPGRLVPSSHPFTSCRPLAIAIHPPASLTTGIWRNGSSRYWVARP